MSTPVWAPRAQRLPDTFLAELRARVSIFDVAVEHCDLKPAGAARYKGLCPFHDERTPSFTVSTDTNRYMCFGCGASGDAIALLTELGGLTFREAVDDLAGRVGMRVPVGDDDDVDDPRIPLRAALNACQPHLHDWLLNHPAGRAAREFLRDRQFSSAHADKWELGYLPPGMQITPLMPDRVSEDHLEAAGMLTEGRNGLYPTFAGRLVWPLRDAQGRIAGYAGRDLDGKSRAKYINTRDTSLYHKHELLFGLHLARKDLLRTKQVFLVEGYTDVMAMVDAGITNTVATCGTAVTGAHAEMLAARIGDGGEVVTAFDNDEAGRSAAWKAFLAVQDFTTNVTTINLSVTDIKGDPCDVRKQLGNDSLAGLTQQRAPLLRSILKADIEAIDTTTPEGKTAARDAAMRRLSDVHDRVLSREYVPLAAQWIGIEPSDFGTADRSHGPKTRKPVPQPPTVQKPAPTVAETPPEAVVAIASTLMYQPMFVDIATWYGNGDLSQLLGDRLADIVENSVVLFPGGRPDPGTDDAELWAQTLLELFDEDYHPTVTVAVLADPCRTEEVDEVLTRIARDAARRRLNSLQQQMDCAEEEDLPELLGKFSQATAHYKKLST